MYFMYKEQLKNPISIKKHLWTSVVMDHRFTMHYTVRLSKLPRFGSFPLVGSFRSVPVKSIKHGWKVTTWKNIIIHHPWMTSLQYLRLRFGCWSFQLIKLKLKSRKPPGHTLGNVSGCIGCGCDHLHDLVGLDLSPVNQEICWSIEAMISWSFEWPISCFIYRIYSLLFHLANCSPSKTTWNRYFWALHLPEDRTFQLQPHVIAGSHLPRHMGQQRHPWPHLDQDTSFWKNIFLGVVGDYAPQNEMAMLGIKTLKLHRWQNHHWTATIYSIYDPGRYKWNPVVNLQ